jgi:hypothetical protein
MLNVPAGQYRFYWDFIDDDGKLIATDAVYTYNININGKRIRIARIEIPKEIWN